MKAIRFLGMALIAGGEERRQIRSWMSELKENRACETHSSWKVTKMFKRRSFFKPHVRLIALVGVIVPRRFRADWKQEWDAELRHREALLADWERLNWRTRVDLLRRSLGALRDALLLQPQRLEEEMFQDLRYGARMLLKNPGFTFIAVLTMALGIGANTALFTVLDALMLRPLPLKNPASLVNLSGVDQSGGRHKLFSYPDYLDYRDRNTTLAELVAWNKAAVVMGALALLLASIGLYGVMSYSVRLRTKEIGIRMAIGAQPRQILKQVVGQGLVLTLLGLGIGLVATLVATRAISSILFGVSAADPATFGAIPFVLLLVALVACYLPARRAMKVDPMRALRHE